MFAQQEDFQAVTKRGAEFARRNFGALSTGFQAIATEVVDFSKRSLEASSATLGKLAEAKTLERAVEVQADFAKATFASFLAHSTKITQL